jgi:hypothetical protein
MRENERERESEGMRENERERESEGMKERLFNNLFCFIYFGFH